MMQSARSTVPLWLRWTLACGLGGALVGALEGGRLQFLATLILTGAIVGVAQYLVYRRLGGWWLVASAVGWIVGTYVTISLSQILDPIVGFFTELGAWEVFWLNVVKQPVALAIFGIAQWLVLRQRVERAEGWIGGSAIAGLAQGGVSAAFCAAFCAPLTVMMGGAIATAVTYGLGWAAYGVVMGVLLERMVRK